MAPPHGLSPAVQIHGPLFGHVSSSSKGAQERQPYKTLCCIGTLLSIFFRPCPPRRTSSLNSASRTDMFLLRSCFQYRYCQPANTYPFTNWHLGKSEASESVGCFMMHFKFNSQLHFMSTTDSFLSL